MNMKVETLPTYRMAFVRQVGPYGPANIQAMEKLKKWAEANHLLTDSAVLLGIPQDNPETTRPEDCRYDACIVISEDYRIDDSIGESELPGRTYAVFKIKHTAEAIQKAWTEILPALQNSGYQMDNHPIIERYTGELVNNDYCEICVPLKA
ncbi:GyrI-like domain-containing protein [Paenibacillus sp. P26]|nr:GyrI-like domain-containing protein [Paenibacillus sp. P26]UUZ96684.1 GyrI-like domain-containing protein [Paenibacillus sp. P25]